MATRTDLIKDIKSEYGPLLSITQVGKYLGYGYDKTKAWLADVDSYKTGKETKYLALDIARKLHYQQMQGLKTG